MVASSPSSLAALAEPRRREIVELVAARGQMAATDICRRFEVTPAAVSQHLKVLREAGVLTVTRQAQRRLYSLNPAALKAIEAWSSRVRATWSSRLDQLDALLKGAH